MAVTGLEITRRAVLAGGKAFGDTGSYEYLVGTVRFAVYPDHPANAGITDLHLAPRGMDGRVHFSADFALLQPVEQQRGNGCLVFDVVNRGQKIAVNVLNNGGPEPDSLGNGFLMRHGFTVAWCGWQHDVPADTTAMALSLVEAREDGAALTGPVMCDFQPDHPAQTLHLPDRGPRVNVALATGPAAQLTVRDHLDTPRRIIPRNLWQFARVEDGRVVSDPGAIHLPSGFEPGKIYEVVYPAEGAPVVGLGLLAVRDIVAWLRYEAAASGNPCADAVHTACGFGASQSGHFLRHFLYLGLNEDERERIVFDGVLVVISGARRGEFNLRFGQPAKTLGEYIGAVFPFSDAEQTDPITGRTDGLMSRLIARGRVPKMLTLDSSAEYWSRQSSLVHTTLDGSADLPLSVSSRFYLMAGTHHGLGVLPPSDQWLEQTRSWHALNSVDFSPLLRAALINLDRWVSAGEEPPLSQYPRLDDGTAAPPEHALEFFAVLPGGHIPNHVPRLPRLDFGPEADRGKATTLPPIAGQPYLYTVPALDPDGNEIAGVRLPDIAAPLATFTGWNVRHPDVGAPGEIILRAGSTLPFPRTEAERQATGDPRRSIKERYASKDDYLQKVRQAAMDLVTARYLLQEDIEPIIARATLRWDLFTAAPKPAPVLAEGAREPV